MGPEITDFVVDLLRRMPLRVEEVASLPYLGDYAFVYAHIGADERIMEAAERALQLGNAGSLLTNTWSPLLHNLRSTERFKKVVRDYGLVDYWRERGWPDLCVRKGETDFACD
jgi:hypothetical protein